ncbi:unnamed protein product, partial [Fusarium graminearum]
QTPSRVFKQYSLLYYAASFAVSQVYHLICKLYHHLHPGQKAQVTMLRFWLVPTARASFKWVNLVETPDIIQKRSIAFQPSIGSVHEFLFGPRDPETDSESRCEYHTLFPHYRLRTLISGATHFLLISNFSIYNLYSRLIHPLIFGSKVQVVAAGGIAGLVSRFVVAPLDVIKIRLQLQPHSLPSQVAALRNGPAYRGAFATLKHILKHEGLTGLWKGNVPAELLYVCYGAVQFTAYRSTTVFLRTAFPSRLPDSAESFIAGAASGAAATSVTYPLDLLRTRFAAQGQHRVYQSLRSAIWDIKRDEGWRGFFRGIGPGLAQIMPFMGIFFVTYESLRSSLEGLHMPWGSGDATAGMCASVISKTVVFPLDLVRKRIQVQGPARSQYVYGNIPEYSTARGAIKTILRTEGFRGLYKGLTISLLKSAPASAVTLWTYEQSLKVMLDWDSSSKETIPNDL